MTCIVGIEHENGVLIGGDSAGVSGYDVAVRADEKVFTVGPFVMGFTSSFRMGQLLRYRLSVTPQPEAVDDMAFMATTFIDSVRQCLKDGGFATVSNNVETGGTFLVGYRDHLYKIESDFQVGRTLVGFDAVGCGFAYALGALQVTPDLSPHDRALSALEAAAVWSGGVSGPFHIIEGSS